MESLAVAFDVSLQYINDAYQLQGKVAKKRDVLQFQYHQRCYNLVQTSLTSMRKLIDDCVTMMTASQYLDHGSDYGFEDRLHQQMFVCLGHVDCVVENSDWMNPSHQSVSPSSIEHQTVLQQFITSFQLQTLVIISLEQSARSKLPIKILGERQHLHEKVIENLDWYLQMNTEVNSAITAWSSGIQMSHSRECVRMHMLVYAMIIGVLQQRTAMVTELSGKLDGFLVDFIIGDIEKKVRTRFNDWYAIHQNQTVAAIQQQSQLSNTSQETMVKKLQVLQKQICRIRMFAMAVEMDSNTEEDDEMDTVEKARKLMTSLLGMKSLSDQENDSDTSGKTGGNVDPFTFPLLESFLSALQFLIETIKQTSEVETVDSDDMLESTIAALDILSVYLWWVERGLDTIVMHLQVKRVSIFAKSSNQGLENETLWGSEVKELWDQALQTIILGPDGLSSPSFNRMHEMISSIFSTTDKQASEWLTSFVPITDDLTAPKVKCFDQDKLRVDKSLRHATSHWQREYIVATMNVERQRMMTLFNSTAVTAINDHPTPTLNMLFQFVGMNL
jgi:hypothetical protein